VDINVDIDEYTVVDIGEDNEMDIARDIDVDIVVDIDFDIDSNREMRGIATEIWVGWDIAAEGWGSRGVCVVRLGNI